MMILKVILALLAARFLFSFFDTIVFKRAVFRRKRGAVGYIYFLTEFGFLLPVVKIGLALDVEQRVNTFRTGTPFFIVVLGHVKVTNRYDAEKAFHRRYKHLRIRKRGEWFWLTPGVLFDIFWTNILWRF